MHSTPSYGTNYLEDDSGSGLLKVKAKKQKHRSLL
ncbi:Uncharacterised protein [Providencia rustigianii]|uniref:Uncharacterized protein n=1 Tax=Providencia rustigianii TaxID=158850 RepID=A0A379G6H7_9GAMM|nr:Uncharacterised protein [Providencia rustigianii]SUC28117.1 Uncharacterised protein [Providencia rustigianii]SUC36482.1 Uncharacterised protein [Providencia rustigianii]VEB73996.1 Uncharacterised protein [Providencia rustigianii]